MKIDKFEVGKVYTQRDLIDSLGGSFLRPRGITPINEKKIIVLVSYRTGRGAYEDVPFKNDITIYTGDGRNGDQKLTGRNKSIYTAKQNHKDILLFVVWKTGQYEYYGKVELIDEPYFAMEKGFDGKMRKAIKFKLMKASSIRQLTKYETEHITVAGITRIEKPTLEVVGAAIVNDVGKVLCAQRGSGSLIGKWEFPGGKIKPGETDQEALIREIKEELNITVEVGELIDENLHEYSDQYVDLKVFKCKQVSGVIKDTEHKALKWMQPEDIETLDWADADIPILETYLDSLPRRIDGEINFDYFEAEAVKKSNKDLVRAVQDYEKSQKAKQKSGQLAEEAVVRFERDKLNNLGRPDLAEKVTMISESNSAAGYDVKSYELNNNGLVTEIHIEVKSAKKSSKYIEFFISENELDKFKNDPNHKIYCLIKIGRVYKLHEVNKSDFFKNDYLSPMTYRVRIRIAE